MKYGDNYNFFFLIIDVLVKRKGFSVEYTTLIWVVIFTNIPPTPRHAGKIIHSSNVLNENCLLLSNEKKLPILG
jgi:hypothetical protein